MAVAVGFVVACAAAPAAAQDQPADTPTRTSLIEKAQAEKVLQPYKPGAAEKYLAYAESYLQGGHLHWHPFFQNAYAGGGFTLGAGYVQRIGSYNTLDVRGSITPSAYKRIEGEFLAPGVFKLPLNVSLLGGWRDATQVGFFGTGMATSDDDRANYSFEQPYGSAAFDLFPARYVTLRAGFEASQWQQGPGAGGPPSVDEVYTPDTLPGLGSSPTYLHSQGTFGFDWRPSPGYARRGGFYGVTFHNFTDTDSAYGFTRMDYEAIQHIPILREAWVISLRAAVQTASAKDNEQIPFFMLPSLGGGSNLRGFSSWRFRDRNALLLQAEWRIMVNRFIDTAVFMDGGKVTAHRSDLNLEGLKTDGGFGLRFHGPLATPVRIDVAKGNEGIRIVFAAQAVF